MVVLALEVSVSLLLALFDNFRFAPRALCVGLASLSVEFAPGDCRSLARRTVSILTSPVQPPIKLHLQKVSLARNEQHEGGDDDK